MAYAALGQYEVAIRDFTEAIRRNPTLASIYRNRAATLMDQRAYDSAIRDCTEAISLAPRDASCYSARGTAYAAKGDIPSASSDFKKAVNLDPKLSLAYSDRGYAALLAGDNHLACALGLSIACDRLEQSDVKKPAKKPVKKAVKKAAAPKKVVYVEQPEPPPSTLAPQERTHIIRQGDNLYRIGIKYNVSWKILMK